jgi:hypothetical protein
MSRFPYAERAREVANAHRALHAAFRKVTKRSNAADPATAKWLASIQAFNTALAAAYPPNFWTDLDTLRAGDPTQIDTVIDFLEADPLFFRSGYAKSAALRVLKRLPLTASQARRLRAVVIHVTATRDDRDFRNYCRLARRLDDEDLRRALGQLQSSDDAAAARRATWVLAALDQPGRE